MFLFVTRSYIIRSLVAVCRGDMPLALGHRTWCRLRCNLTRSDRPRSAGMRSARWKIHDSLLCWSLRSSQFLIELFVTKSTQMGIPNYFLEVILRW
jgi:hypothetical protein